MSIETQRLVQSVSRAIAILEAIAGGPQGFRLKQLADSQGLACQTTQSLLRTLQHHGYVVQDGRGEAYRLGPALSGLLRRWYGAQDRAGIMRPAVEACRDALSENVVLSEIQGGVLVSVVECRVDSELSVGSTPTLRDTIHLRANGKLLLSHMEEGEREAIIQAADFDAGTELAARTRDALLDQLATVRATGIARSYDEVCKGVSALAVGVGAPGRIRMALGCNLPSARLTRSRERVLLNELQQAAKRVAEISRDHFGADLMP